MKLRLPSAGVAMLLVFTRPAPGAPPPSPGEAAKTHWAFQPVRAVEPPAVRKEDWVRTPAERFILAKLEEKQIAPAPAATHEFQRSAVEVEAQEFDR